MCATDNSRAQCSPLTHIYIYHAVSTTSRMSHEGVAQQPSCNTNVNNLLTILFSCMAYKLFIGGVDLCHKHANHEVSKTKEPHGKCARQYLSFVLSIVKCTITFYKIEDPFFVLLAIFGMA